MVAFSGVSLTRMLSGISMFSGTSALIAAIMLVEYLLLKGADRSEIYRRELELARLRRRDDLLTLRQIENELTDLRERLARPPAEGDPAADAPARLEEARGAVDRLLQLLHPPR